MSYCSIRQILHCVVRDNQKDWAFKLSAPSFRVGSTTLREFPLPSVKKQMAASTYKTLMSSCGWRKLAPQSKPVLPLKSRLINLFSIPHQWKNLISYYKISQLVGDNLQGSIWGSFLVNSHKALMIPLEELAQWLAATAGLTPNCRWWVKGYVQQSLYGQIHNAATKIGQQKLQQVAAHNCNKSNVESKGTWAWLDKELATVHPPHHQRIWLLTQPFNGGVNHHC